MAGIDGYYFQGSATAHHCLNKVVGDGLMVFHPDRHSMSGVGIECTHCSFCCVQHKKKCSTDLIVLQMNFIQFNSQVYLTLT